MPALHNLRLLAILPATLLFHGTASAQDRGVVYAGGGIGDGRNVYAGGVIALPGGRLGRGLAIRGGGAAGSYVYDSGTAEIDGNFASAEVALVYQTSGEWGWANFGAGPRVTNTSLTPNDPNNRLAGTRFDVGLQTDGALGYRWRLGWFGSLGVNDEIYFTNLSFGPLVDEPSQTRIGVEAGIAGDETFTRRNYGVFASTRIASKTELRVSGGLNDQRGLRDQAYATVALSKVF